MTVHFFKLAPFLSDIVLCFLCILYKDICLFYKCSHFSYPQQQNRLSRQSPRSRASTDFDSLLAKKKKDTALASFSLNSYQFSFCFIRLRVLAAAHKKSHAQKNKQQNPSSFSHTESPFRTTSRFQVTNFPPIALQYTLSSRRFIITG